MALAATEGVRAVSALRLRWSGRRLHADATVDVDADLSIADAHAVAHRAEANLITALPRLSSVVLHPHPRSRSAKAIHDATESSRTPSEDAGEPDGGDVGRCGEVSTDHAVGTWAPAQ